MRKLLLILGLSTALAAPAHAGVDLWIGYGLGLHGDRNVQLNQRNSHLMGGFSWYREQRGPTIRIIRGSLERTDVPVHGDNDLDYYAVDWLSGQRNLPVQIGFGLGYYQQAGPVRSPGGGIDRKFESVWAPHFAVARHWRPRGRWSTWAELEIHDVPLTPSIVIVTADVGLTWHIHR